MSISVGAPVPSFATSCQRVWMPRWKPMPMQLMAVASASLAAGAVVYPESPRTPEPLACSVGSKIRLSQVQPRRPAAL
jgi:hypothetical protein